MFHTAQSYTVLVCFYHLLCLVSLGQWHQRRAVHSWGSREYFFFSGLTQIRASELLSPWRKADFFFLYSTSSATNSKDWKGADLHETLQMSFSHSYPSAFFFFFLHLLFGVFCIPHHRHPSLTLRPQRLFPRLSSLSPPACSPKQLLAIFTSGASKHIMSSFPSEQNPELLMAGCHADRRSGV